MKKNILIFTLSTVFIFYLGAPAMARLINQSIGGQRIVFDDVNNLWWYPRISDFMYYTKSEAQTRVYELRWLKYAGFNNWQIASRAQVDNLVLSFNEGNDTRSGFSLPWEPFSDYFTPVYRTDDCCVWGATIPDCRSDDYGFASTYYGWISDGDTYTYSRIQYLFYGPMFSELVSADTCDYEVPGAWVVATSVAVSGDVIFFDDFADEPSARFVIEAEKYSIRRPGLSAEWLEVDGNTNIFLEGPIAGTTAPTARNGARRNYMEALGQNINEFVPIESAYNGPFLDYRILVGTTGVYRLYVRWTAEDIYSDSLYAFILKPNGKLLKGAGPDWFVYHQSRPDWIWDNRGVMNTTATSGAGFPHEAVWTILEPGEYTIRIAMRESGTALDALVFQTKDLEAPNGYGPYQSHFMEYIIIDNGDDGTLNTGWWESSVNGDRYGPTHNYTYWAGSTYTWTAFLKGTYEVGMWWRAYPDWCKAVPVSIYDGNTLLDTVYVDQSRKGGQWNPLGGGSYEFTGEARIVVTSPGGGCGIDADAIRIYRE